MSQETKSTCRGGAAGAASALGDRLCRRREQVGERAQAEALEVGGGGLGPALVGERRGGRGVEDLADLDAAADDLEGALLGERADADDPLRLEQLDQAQQVAIAGGLERPALVGGQL